MEVERSPVPECEITMETFLCRPTSSPGSVHGGGRVWFNSLKYRGTSYQREENGQYGKSWQ
jgi:hypothetical protein